MAVQRMAQGKIRRIAIVAGLVAIVVVAGALLLTRHTAKMPIAATSDTAAEAAASKNTSAATDDTAKTTATTASTTADPSTFSSVDVQPLGITVFYTKGTPGFEYTINKTTDGTQYVEFTSTDLVGTKCTDDEGLIASIIKNPNSTEDQTTISQTVKVGEDTYGLSLASAGCTANTDLLTTYQTGFKDGFSSLKAL